MTLNPRRLEALVMRMQNDFLATPGLELTPSEAQQRFGVACDALLGVLVDANVLARTGDGAYVRFFPRGDRGGNGAADGSTSSPRIEERHDAAIDHAA